MAAAAEKVRALEPEMILYGHHGPIVGEARIQEELIAYRDAIHHVHDATVEGMNAGEDVHTLMRQIEIPPEMVEKMADWKASQKVVLKATRMVNKLVEHWEFLRAATMVALKAAMRVELKVVHSE